MPDDEPGERDGEPGTRHDHGSKRDSGTEHGGGTEQGGVPGGELRAYHAKRRFDRTGEPRGLPASTEDAAVPADGEAAEPGAGHRFVVQIHAASTTHFDFRLEVDGVLKSWSVPRGPSTDPGDKRLAVPTEDHPLEYRAFEGVIPPGEYGGGTVIVWDHGTYRPTSHDRRHRPVPFARSLELGHATFWLDGTKLRGGYALTRFRDGEGGSGRAAWLLVKSRDERARRDGHGTPDPRRARSARSGRTLRQVAERPEAVWESDRGGRRAGRPGSARG
ncbi:3'-phosphoesterase [Streptomyces uncialis]|uniref:DNA polymerase ligase N-terminal domain-containing protein n=1 Tax=Streptomyces uncialis TaxID=1048205 RepID=UPI002E325459|nr:DNA polymerase ligase N-terminal domain-containing protein [Streptomyces uncialis]